jgi:hypothetical protein
MSIHREDRSRFDLGLVLVRTDSTMRGESGIDNYGVAIQMIDLRGGSTAEAPTRPLLTST